MAARWEMVGVIRQRQQMVTRVSVSLKALARSRWGEARRRKKQRECDVRWFNQRWMDLLFGMEDLIARAEWFVQQQVVSMVQKAAMVKKMRHEVEVRVGMQVASEKERLKERETAFRRLLVAEQKAKQSRVERRQQPHLQQGQKASKKSNQKPKERHETKHGNKKVEGVECENANPLRYVKKAEEIRSKEPKVPWQRRKSHLAT